MTVASTSKQAYRGLKQLGDKQRIVRDALAGLGIATNEEISIKLGWPINCVTGRTRELRAYGHVIQHGLKTGRSGATAKTWCVKDPNEKKAIDLASDPIEDIDPKLWKPKAIPWND